jgi:hypothetical protein
MAICVSDRSKELELCRLSDLSHGWPVTTLSTGLERNATSKHFQLSSAISWLANNWGSLVNVLGLLATIVGFGLALATLRRTATAAEAAKHAAEDARIEIYKVDVITVCSDLLARLEEIKHLHREGQAALLPSRYSEARSLLVAAGVAVKHLHKGLQTDFGEMLDAIDHFETRVDVFVTKGRVPDFVKFNAQIVGFSRKIRTYVQELKASAGKDS